MDYKLVVLFALVILRVESDGEKSVSVDIYPGFGWDHLRYLEMNPIFNVSNFNNSKIFQSCIEVVPIYDNQIDFDSTVIDMFDARTSDFSSNLFFSVGIGKFWEAKIAGSYSQDYQRSKKQQGEQKTIALRNQIEYIMYDVLLTSSCQLSSLVKKALIEISNYQTNNETIMAKYAAQLFVKTYGTHFTSRLRLGGSIVQEDHIKKTTYYEDNSRTHKYRAAALASFLLTFDVSASYGWMTNESNFTNETREFTQKIVRAKGGKLNLSRGTIESWQSSIDSKPAIIRRAIENITSFIQSDKIPELSEIELKNVRDEVNAAVETYFEMNAYKGCMNRTSPSFNWVANVDDGACAPAEENSQFGGFIRTCTEDNRMTQKCTQYTIKNYYTSTEECPANFNKYLLRQSTELENLFIRHCQSCGFLYLKQCCKDVPNGVGQRVLNLYGCNSRTNQLISSAEGLTSANDYVYGGSFTNTKVNPVTGFQGCPSEPFQTVNVINDLKVCLGERIEDTDGLPHYGGIYSCDQENIAFQNISKSCPTGYSSYVMSAIDENCLLYVCLKFEKFPDIRQLPSIILPPFFSISLPNRTKNVDVLNFDKTNTVTLVLAQKSHNSIVGWLIGGFVIGVLVVVATIFILFQNGYLNHQRNQDGYIPL